MKRLYKMLTWLVAILGLCLACGCGCGKKADERDIVHTTGKYTISEYDIETDTIGNEITDKTFRCGKDYILQFEFDFEKLKHSKIETTLQVQLGILDNKINLEWYDYDESKRKKGQFYRTDSGIWEMEFDISSKSVPDFSEVRFVLSVDSLEENVNMEEVIAFSFSSEDYQFKINGLNEMQIPITFSKGIFDFTAENIYESGDFVIKVPEHCTYIEVSMYEDEKYTKLCGKQTYTKESFLGDALVVTLNEDTLMSLRTKELKNEPLIIYLRITVEGGYNYLCSTLDMEYVID